MLRNLPRLEPIAPQRANTALTPKADIHRPDRHVRQGQAAFLWFGLVQGIVVILVTLLLRAPEAGEVPASQVVQQSRRDYRPAEVLKTPPFWAMYVMFVLVAAGGLMAVAQLALIAKDSKVDAIPVTLLV